MNARELVQLGIDRGWIKLPAAEQSHLRVAADRRAKKREWYRQRQERFKQQGLTCFGKPYKNKKHPELKGLSGKAYHLEYIRRQRKGLL